MEYAASSKAPNGFQPSPTVFCHYTRGNVKPLQYKASLEGSRGTNSGSFRKN